MGSFVKEQQHGLGTMTWRDGQKYEGTWDEGMKSGHGLLTQRSGESYKGSFFSDQIEGEGVYQFVDGTVYTGTWKDGKQNGQCRMDSPAGDWEEVNWVNGKRHGDGILYKIAKDAYFRQIWSHGELTKFFPTRKERVEQLKLRSIKKSTAFGESVKGV